MTQPLNRALWPRGIGCECCIIITYQSPKISRAYFAQNFKDKTLFFTKKSKIKSYANQDESLANLRTQFSLSLSYKLLMNLIKRNYIPGLNFEKPPHPAVSDHNYIFI